MVVDNVYNDATFGLYEHYDHRAVLLATSCEKCSKTARKEHNKKIQTHIIADMERFMSLIVVMPTLAMSSIITIFNLGEAMKSAIVGFQGNVRAID